MMILTPCVQPCGSNASLKYKSVNLFSGSVEAIDSIPVPSLYQTRHQVSYLQDKSTCLTADAPQSSMLGPPSRQSSGTIPMGSLTIEDSPMVRNQADH